MRKDLVPGYGILMKFFLLMRAKFLLKIIMLLLEFSNVHCLLSRSVKLLTYVVRCCNIDYWYTYKLRIAVNVYKTFMYLVRIQAI